MHRRLISSALATFLLLASAFAAEPAGDAQAKEKLRAATLQLRAAETERDAAKAARDTLAEENKKLAEDLAALRKQTVADGVALKKTKDDLNGKVAERDEEIASLRKEVAQRDAALAQAEKLRLTLEAARQQLVDEKAALGNTIAQREHQNIELYRLAGEILRRYEQFSFGEALAAKEPFLGHTRAKLETQVQDYRDKLIAQRAPAAARP